MKTWGRYLDIEDQRQEAELARLIAAREGADPEVAARRAMARADKAEQRHKARFVTNYGDAGEALRWVPEEGRLVGRRAGPAEPGEAKRATARITPAQRRRAIRDRIILASSRAGFSEREIATAFGLAGSSSVHRILAAMRAGPDGHPPRERADDGE